MEGQTGLSPRSHGRYMVTAHKKRLCTFVFCVYLLKHTVFVALFFRKVT